MMEMSDKILSIIRRIRYWSILFFLLFASHVAIAEELGVEDVVNPGNGEAAVPLDGGASLLLAAAAGLGAYRLNRNRKKNPDPGYSSTKH